MAINLVDELDTWCESLAAALEIRVTRDPARVAPPCLYLDMPDSVGVTLGAVTLNQPIWLVAAGGGKAAADQMLGLLPAVLVALNTSDATAQTLSLDGTDYHAYRIPTPLHITEE